MITINKTPIPFGNRAESKQKVFPTGGHSAPLTFKVESVKAKQPRIYDPNNRMVNHPTWKKSRKHQYKEA